MIAIDTSVAVAAFAGWHQAHERSAAVLARDPRLPAHVVLETFSVLTRLPPPHRLEPSIAASLLDHPILTVSGARYLQTTRTLAEAGIGGGAIYDAIVAATAVQHDATLVTRDRRALPIYELIGADVEMLG